MYEPFLSRFIGVSIPVSFTISAEKSAKRLALGPYKSQRAGALPTIEPWAIVTTHRGDENTNGIYAHGVLIVSNSTKTEKRAFLH